MGSGVFVGSGVAVGGLGVEVGAGVAVAGMHIGSSSNSGRVQSGGISFFSSSPSPSSSSSVVGVTVGVPPSCACVSTENAQRPNNVTATMIAAHTANST